MSSIMETSSTDRRVKLLKRMISSGTKFTAHLYRLISNDDEDLIFSPISIYIALVLTYLGAEGKTAEELKKHLHLPGTKHISLKGIRLLLDELKSPNLSTVTEMFIEKSYKIKRTYRKAAKKYLDSETQLLDFQYDATKAEAFINSWVLKRTNGKINDLIPRDLLDSSTRLVLVSAIHFKDNWREKFYERDTYTRDFHVSKQKSVKVQMMTQTEYFGYAETDTYKALKLPYANGKFRMIIFLPNEIDGLSALEQQIFSTGLRSSLRNMREREVKVHIPKFKFEKFFDLNESLKKLGITSMFREDADFSGIHEENEQPLHVSDVMHKAFIEVNEKGTEAAAATAVRGVILCGRPTDLEDIKTFEADHPFLFFILNENRILFVGKKVNMSE